MRHSDSWTFVNLIQMLYLITGRGLILAVQNKGGGGGGAGDARDNVVCKNQPYSIKSMGHSQSLDQGYRNELWDCARKAPSSIDVTYIGNFSVSMFSLLSSLCQTAGSFSCQLMKYFPC